MEENPTSIVDALFGDEVEKARGLNEVRRQHIEKMLQQVLTALVMFVFVGLLLATAIGLWWRFIGVILFRAC